MSKDVKKPGTPTSAAAPKGARRARLAERADLKAEVDDLPEVQIDDPAQTPGDLPDKLYFRIGEVSQLVGVDTHVLRYWESEFRMKPHRSSSGQRLYRKQDLARFLRIKHLLHDEGYTIAGARKVLAGNTSASPTVDPSMLKDALSRLVALRAKIRRFKDELDIN